MEEIIRDERYMGLALNEARRAYEEKEIPVGALVVHGDEVLASTCNQPIAMNDPSAHAEILAIRRAAEKVGNYRLNGATVYVTLEPCIMCVGAMIHARISRLVFGAYDGKSGAVVSLLRLLDDERLNHRIDFSGGILQGPCGEILSRFFREKRISSPPASAA
jgi:tRNA(adenine34) deaminase